MITQPPTVLHVVCSLLISESAYVGLCPWHVFFSIISRLLPKLYRFLAIAQSLALFEVHEIPEVYQYRTPQYRWNLDPENGTSVRTLETKFCPD